MPPRQGNGRDIHFDGRSWEENRQHIQHEIQRNADELANLTGIVNSLMVRLAVVEAKALIYGGIGGALGMMLVERFWK